MATPSRLELMQSQKFLQLQTFANAGQLGRLFLADQHGEEFFEGWSLQVFTLDDAAATNPLTAGDVIVGSLSNGAPGDHGSLQSLAFFRQGD